MLDSLSHYYLPGAVPIWCAVFFSLAALWGYALAMRGDDSARLYARRGYLFFALSIVITAAMLVVCLYRRDFRIEYVSQYSGLDLATHFQISAFWAGQKGSFLIWLLWGTLIGLPLSRSAGKDEAPVMWVYLLTLFGLLFILVRENPFVMLQAAPPDGAGLNPLLQDDWMVIHPPVMFVGYAASAVPFAFAIAALWKGDTSRWAARAFPWALGGFLVLGTAILMGGYWAYRTLGWGGYWGWDPVENASLIPWLFGTVLVHGLYLERTKGRYRRANLVLACLVYLSVVYGTFLTRSGVLADFSVHSFVDLGLTVWLLAIMGFFLLLSVGLLVWRLPSVATRRNEDPLLSRGAFVMMATITVGLMALLVTIGTSAPILTAPLEHRGQVGPSYYNRFSLPLALVVSLLLACVPFLTWRGTPFARLARKLAPSAGLAVIGGAAAVVLGVHEPFHLLFLCLAILAASANLHKVIELARSGGMGKLGGYLSHVGVGCIFVGVLASSAYDVSTKVTLEQGVPQRVDDLTLTFNRFIPRQGAERERMEVKVTRDDGFSYLAYPQLFVNDRTGQIMPHPHIKKLLLQDLYMSPIQFAPGEPPGTDKRFQLAKGEAETAGGVEVRFVDFDLSSGGSPAVQLAKGGQVTVGADLEVTRDGETKAVTALYRFQTDGKVETPPVELPGGGWLALTGIIPTTGKVQIDLAGITTPPTPSRLSVDLTRKPLIKLVWYGLYVVLLGGALSTVSRFRKARRIDEMEARSGPLGAEEPDPEVAAGAST